MNRFKYFTIILGVVLLVVVASSALFPKQSDQKIIAITQIIEHPSLDEERHALLAYLAQEGYVDGKNVKIIYQNAQGNLATAAQIAKQFVSQKPDLIIGITTPTAQSVLAALDTAQIPFVFTAVTDPLDAKLVANLQNPGQGISGVMDKLDAQQQIAMIKKFIPNVKKIGVIYNPGLINSVRAYSDLENAAQEFGISLVAGQANSTKDVSAVTQTLVGKVAALYIPNDTVIAPGLPSILQVAYANQIPVFAADVGSVQTGALAATAYDCTKKGILAGKIAVEFLQNGYQHEIPVTTQIPLEVWINPTAAKLMGVTMPAELSANVHIVENV